MQIRQGLTVGSRSSAQLWGMLNKSGIIKFNCQSFVLKSVCGADSGVFTDLAKIKKKSSLKLPVKLTEH